MGTIGALIIGLGIVVVGSDNVGSGSGCGEPQRPCVMKMRIGGPGAQTNRPNYDGVDHSTFDCLLRRFVDCRGQVCYQSWKSDCAAVFQLQNYIVSLGQVRTDDTKASVQGQFAYYINAYNALVIWGILHEYPTSSIQAHNHKTASYRIFEDLEMWVDGDYLSLNTIEHDVLRKLGDFRIHFALVCAAKSCPKLRCEAYSADRLEEQLVENALDFFSHSDRLQICKLTGAVKVSPILKWFREDFGHCDNDVLNAILPYLSCTDHDWVCRHPCATIKYLGYNWALNDQCPTPGVKLGATPYALYAKFEPILRPLLPKKDSQPSQHSDAEIAMAAPPIEAPKPTAAENPSKLPAEPPAPKAIDPKDEKGRPADPPPPKALNVNGSFGYTPGKAILLYGGLLPRMVIQPVPQAITSRPTTGVQTR